MINISKHREEMIYILKNIYSSTELASTLAFKGGTACYLFYDLPRFSTDLDFNLIDNNKAEEVLHILEKNLTQRGTIREKYVKELTVFLLYVMVQTIEILK